MTDIDDLLSENTDLLARALRHGSPEVRGHVLALYANAETAEPVDQVIDLLEQIREDKPDAPGAA